MRNYEIYVNWPVSPDILYDKQKQENHIRDNMDLTLAITELEKIIEWHLLGIEFKTPKSVDIVEPEHIINQELLSKARKIYASHMEHETTTECELEERRIDFNKHIYPFVKMYSKLIYSTLNNEM